MGDERLVRAAQYVRMSTERQTYSLEYQSLANAAYAAEHGFEIVRTYTDAGISGLDLRKREGLKALLADALSRERDFTTILVYDVSRWGRFQDPDEAAHYEFICRTAGVSVRYAAEPFVDDGGLTGALVKNLKRAMAAEYSRELSARVSRAKRGLAAAGYWSGSACSYGFRRQVVAPDGTRGAILEPGERKALQGHRIVLALGPPQEVAVVRRIFREFVIHGLAAAAISYGLNAEGLTGAGGRPWTRGRIHRLLTDEKYAGVLVSGRRKTCLRESVEVPRDQWIRVPGGCPALVDRRLFDIAQANLVRRAGLEPYRRPGSDAELIAVLRGVLAAHGRLSANIIRISDCPYRPALFARRFGSLSTAYALAGYSADRRQGAAAVRYDRTRTEPAVWELGDAELLRRLKALFARRGKLTSALIDEEPDLPCTSTISRRFGDMASVWALVGCAPSERQFKVHAACSRRRAAAEGPPSLFGRAVHPQRR